MPMHIWTGDCKNLLEIMNMKVYDENGKYVVIVNERDWKVSQFSSNIFWKNIGCPVSAPTFAIGGLRLWEKEEAQ